MLRDKSLIPLSHQHQHALALCVRIDRASPINGDAVAAWQAEISQLFQSEISVHFSAEEKILFPAAREVGELTPLVEELLADHTALREHFARAEEGQFSAVELLAFAQRLSAHVRKEERELFEGMQRSMSHDELAALGQQLEGALKDAVQACSLRRDETTSRKRS